MKKKYSRKEKKSFLIKNKWWKWLYECIYFLWHKNFQTGTSCNGMLQFFLMKRNFFPCLQTYFHFHGIRYSIVVLVVLNLIFIVWIQILFIYLYTSNKKLTRESESCLIATKPTFNCIYDVAQKCELYWPF